MSTLTLTLNTDAHILDTYRAGNTEQAATLFVRKHQRFVYSIALRYVQNPEDARDATQEVFIRALQGLGKFKGESTLQTWLYRITANVCSNMRRKNRWLNFFAIGEGEGEKDVQASHQLSPAEDATQSDFERYFKQVLTTLPPKQRETFCLRYFDDLSYEEISDMIGTSVGALKANYHWAVKKIAEQLRTSEYYQPWMEVQHEKE